MNENNLENTTPELLPDGPHMSPADNEGAVPQPKEPNTLSLDEINEYLGKSFKDKDTALKALKDTFSYVGKRKEDIVKEVTSTNEQVFSELRQMKENMFFKDNPDYAPYRALMSKMGDNPELVAQTPEFKEIFEKAKGYDESQKLKSMLSSNPRLAGTKDTLGQARQAQTADEAVRLATRAVLDSIL